MEAIVCVQVSKYIINVYVINLPFHVVVRMSLTSVVCVFLCTACTVYYVHRVLCTAYVFSATSRSDTSQTLSLEGVQ